MSWQRRGDIALVLLLVVMTESLAWGGPGPGDPLTGPRPVAAALPLLLDVPLLLRRRYPLAVMVAVAAGVAAQALISGRASEGLHIVVPLTVAGFAVARHGLERRSEVGLAVLLGGYLAFLTQDHNVRYGGVGERWAAAFFAAVLVVAWSAGLFARSRRLAQDERDRARAAEERATAAVTEERHRMARELHDIVSHNLSAVVLQASGARAQGGSDDATLEKIETSGRRALNEMRSLLGVLRADDDQPLEPLPGVADLPALAEAMAGPVVELRVDDCGDLPAGLQLTIYRIVQEAMTNTMKHAHATRCDVAVRRESDRIVVEVSDDGTPTEDPGSGHGLIGMHERCSIAGGELYAGPGPEGFTVRATIPTPP